MLLCRRVRQWRNAGWGGILVHSMSGVAVLKGKWSWFLQKRKQLRVGIAGMSGCVGTWPFNFCGHAPNTCWPLYSTTGREKGQFPDSRQKGHLFSPLQGASCHLPLSLIPLSPSWPHREYGKTSVREVTITARVTAAVVNSAVYYKLFKSIHSAFIHSGRL